MSLYKHFLILSLSLFGGVALAAGGNNPSAGQMDGQAGAGMNNTMPDAIQAENNQATNNQAKDGKNTSAEKNMSAESTAATAIDDKAMDDKSAMHEQSGFSRGSVVRSIFTSAVDQREPVDKLKKLNTEQSKLVYFTELRDMTGQMAKHRWQYNGEVVAEVDFKVRGPRWRVWSSKALNPTKEGEWKVSVLNGAGDVIAEEVIEAADATMMQKGLQKEMQNGMQQNTDSGTGETEQKMPAAPAMQ